MYVWKQDDAMRTIVCLMTRLKRTRTHKRYADEGRGWEVSGMGTRADGMHNDSG